MKPSPISGRDLKGFGCTELESIHTDNYALLKSIWDMFPVVYNSRDRSLDFKLYR